MNRREYIYGIFDSEEMIFKGTNEEVADAYGVTPKSVYYYAIKGMRLKKKYGVKFLNKPGRSVEPKRIRTKEEIQLEHLVTHLKIYSNCASVFDPVPYYPELLDLGMNCRCHEFHDKDGTWYMTELA